MTGIFISYRRADSGKDAGRIADRLRAHFEQGSSPHQVFFDTESIATGEEFPQAIRNAVEQSTVMLVIIGSQWVNMTDAGGRQRLAKEGDFVRLEVSLGLNKPSMTVIPVRLDDTPMPDAQSLPQPLQPLTTRNAVSIRTDNEFFSRDINFLIESIEEILGQNEDEIDQQEKISYPSASKQENKNGCTSPVSRWIGGLFSVIVALLGLYLAFVQILPEDQQRDILARAGLVTRVPTVVPSPVPTTTPIPPLLDTDRSDAIMSAAARIPIANIVSDPRDLLVAPSPDGIAVWGYAGAGSALFAIDIATQTPVDLTPDNPETVTWTLEGVRPGGLHYDGQWLWIADSAGQSLIAVDPLRLERLEVTGTTSLRGTPRNIQTAGSRLWVTFTDIGQVAAFDINHASQTATFACNQQYLDIGEAPIHLVAQGQTALWVGYGRIDGQIRKINASTCTLDEPVSFDGRIDSLSVAVDSLWVTVNQTLWQVNPITGQTTEQNIDDIRSASGLNGHLWLVTDTNRLQKFDTERGEPVMEMNLLSSPTAFLSYGFQLWVATEDNNLTLLTVPDYHRSNWVDITLFEEDVWGLTEDGQLCSLQTETCIAIALDETAIRLITGASNDGFRVATTGNTIASVTAEGEVSQRYTTSLTVTDMVDTGDYLWFSDGFLGLRIMDTASGQIYEAQNFNLSVPDTLAYDGTSVWLGYTTQGRFVSASFDDSIVREEQSLNVELQEIQAATADDEFIYIAERGILKQIPHSHSQSATVSETGISNRTHRILAGENQIWLFDRQTGFIYKIDHLSG